MDKLSDSTVVGQLALELGIDTDGLRRQLTQATDNADKQLTAGFSKIGKKIGGILGGLAAGAFIKDCLDLGSDLAEVQNVVDTSFKSMSSYVDNFAKDAMENFGLSETVAKQYMGTLGAMNNAFGFTEQASYDMAKAVTGLTGDVASFYNLESDEAFTKLKSIWTGETETLKDLGVVMTQTALDQYALNNGFGKTTAKMTEQEKVLLRYQYVTSALSDATGDFVKTQDSWANQTRVLSLRFDSLKASLGQGFINLFTPIIKGLNVLLTKLSTAAEGFKNFTAFITGNTNTTEGLGNIASTASDAAGEVDNITSSAKEAQKQLMGFDKITKLSDKSDSGGTAGASSGNGGIAADIPINVDTGNSETAIDGIRKKLDSFKNWAVKNFGPSFKNIWKDFQKNTETFKSNLGRVFQDIKSLGPSLTDYFNGPFTEYLVAAFDTTGLIVNGLYDTFNLVFEDIWNNAVFPVLRNFIDVGLPMITDFSTQMQILSGTIFSVLKDCFDRVWSEGVSPYLTLISDMWIDLMNTISDFWNKWGQPIFDGINKAVKNTGDMFQTIWETILKPVWDNIMVVIDEVWTKHLQPLVANFLDFVGEFVDGALVIYNEFIAPVVKFLSSVLGPVFVAVFNSISNSVGSVIGTILDIINGLITSFKGIVQFLKGVFTGDLDVALTGIKNIFKGVFDSLVAIVKTPINLIIDVLNGLVSGVTSGINTVIRAVNKLSFDVPDWVPGIGGEKFGFNLKEISPPRIPKLAQGGYVKPNTPQLAMIGDNKHQGEVVAPEDKLSELLQKAVLASSGGYDREILVVLREILVLLKELDLNIVIDGKKLKDVIVQRINENTRVTGVCEINT